MSIFKTAAGQAIINKDGKADMGGGFKVLPEGTVVKVMMAKAEWKSYEGQKYINIEHKVIDGEHKGTVIFQKVKVYESDPKKSDKARIMLAAIDACAGGNLQQLQDIPTDMDLMKHLQNKILMVKLGVWDMDGKSGNWVNQVAPVGELEAVSPSAPPAPTDQGADIPF